MALALYGFLHLHVEGDPRILLWCGPPRSGKTYHAVAVMLAWAAQGGVVVTNVPLTREIARIYRVTDEELGPAKIIETCERYRQGAAVLIVIDEASIAWDSREWARVGAEVRGYLATVGHRRTSVIVIGQSVSMIDTTFRRLARFLVQHRDATAGVLGLFTSDVRSWRLYEGADDTFETVVDRGWFVVGPGLPYRSFEGGGGKNPLSGLTFRSFGLLALAIGVFFATYFGGGWAHAKIKQAVDAVNRRFGRGKTAPPVVRKASVDPFALPMRVSGVGDDFLLIERADGQIERVQTRPPSEWLEKPPESVTLGQLMRLKLSHQRRSRSGH